MPVGDRRQKGGFPCLGIILHRPPLDLASNARICILYLYFSFVFCNCRDSCILPGDHLTPTAVRPRIKRWYLYFSLVNFVNIFCLGIILHRPQNLASKSCIRIYKTSFVFALVFCILFLILSSISSPPMFG